MFQTRGPAALKARGNRSTGIGGSSRRLVPTERNNVRRPGAFLHFLHRNVHRYDYAKSSERLAEEKTKKRESSLSGLILLNKRNTHLSGRIKKMKERKKQQK